MGEQGSSTLLFLQKEKHATCFSWKPCGLQRADVPSDIKALSVKPEDTAAAIAIVILVLFLRFLIIYMDSVLFIYLIDSFITGTVHTVVEHWDFDQ